MKIFLLYFFFFFLLSTTDASIQSVQIQGRLLCRGKPAQFAELQLLDWSIFGSSIMAENVYTDGDGYFDIYGYVDQFLSINGRLLIWHECFEEEHVHKGKCKNWMEFEVPAYFVNRERIARNVWKMGRIDLEKEQKGDHLDKCS